MILYVLMGLASVFGVFWTLKEKKIFPGIVTLGMVLGILLAFILGMNFRAPGYYVYSGFVALAFVYGIISTDKSIWSRLIIVLMSTSIFLYWLWVLNNWHGNTVLLPILTLLVGVLGLISKAKLRSELGFLTILAVDAIAIIVENWMKAN